MHDRVKVHETSMLDLYLIRLPCLMANKMSKLGISQETGVRISSESILTFFSLKNQRSCPGKYYF
jgi:hypothetical protein